MKGHKNSHINRSWQALGCLLLLCACAEVIDLGTEFGPTNLLVYGRFTNGLYGNTIELAQTSPFNARQDPIGGARINLVKENGDRQPYVETEEGTYVLFDRSSLGQPGQTYYIEMTLASGERYESEPAVMPNKVSQDYIDWKARTQVIPVRNGAAIVRNVVEFSMRTEIFDPEEEPLIRWNLMETYWLAEYPRVRLQGDPPLRCFVTKTVDVQDVLFYDGSELRATEIAPRTMLARKHDSIFYDSYWFHAIQSSLTPDAFRFWQQVEDVANRQGSIFDTPLGPIRSNVFNVNNPGERVLGYFEVAHVDTTRVFIDDNDIHFRVKRPCIPGTPYEPPECWDCLVLEGATKDIPYWMD